MLKAGWALLPLLAVAGPGGATEPSPFDGIPGIRFDYYDIKGTTAVEIYASMRARGPRADDGDAVARTEWRIRAGWRESHQGSQCAVADPLTSLSITVLLPRLATPEARVTPDGLDFWRRSLRGMEIHEAGHARIAYEHRDDFVALARDAQCNSIKALAAKAEAGVIALQRDYDRETQHGIAQVPPAVPAS